MVLFSILSTFWARSRLDTVSHTGKDWPGRSLKPQNVFSALKERFGKKAKVRVEDAERAEDQAPYRGAYGFPPIYEDAQSRMFGGYVSPYSLFLEAIGDMLDCDVSRHVHLSDVADYYSTNFSYSTRNPIKQPFG